MDDPQVLTIVKFANGAYSFDDLLHNDDVHSEELIPLEEAITQQWKSDRHFSAYRILEDDEVCARINKAAVASIEHSGFHMCQTMMVLDMDFPDHATWAQMGLKQSDVYEEFSAWCDCLEGDLAQVANWRWWYSTKGGWRVIWVLNQPVNVKVSEQHTQWFIKTLADSGFPVDPKCFDWTRLFRLPCVNRDGHRTEEQSYFHIQYNDGTVDVSNIGMAGTSHGNIYGDYEVYEGDRPTPEECTELLVMPRFTNSAKVGRKADTPFFRTFKKHTRNFQAFDDIYRTVVSHEMDAIPVIDGRDNAIMRTVGKLTSRMIFKHEGTTPAHTFALLAPWVEQFDPDAGTPDWLESLWDKCKRCWSNDSARIKFMAGEAEEKNQERAECLDDLCWQILEEDRHTEFSRFRDEDDNFIREYVTKHLIVIHGRNMYMMTKDGGYCIHPTRPEGNPIGSARDHLDGLIPLWYTNKKTGETTALKFTTIKEDHSREVSDIVCRPLPFDHKGPPLGYLKKGKVLELPTYGLHEDVQAVYHEEVNKWLIAICSTRDDRRSLQLWLAHAVDYTRPICALALIGASMTGKSLLIAGLSRCFTSGDYATGGDIVQDFNVKLQNTPVVAADEGWSVNQFNRQLLANRFRELVTNGRIEIQPKRIDKYTVHNYMRFLMVANNDDVITDLISLKNGLSETDIKAIGQRILRIEVKNYPYFEHNSSKGWIKQGPNGKLTEHIMWLSMNINKFGDGTEGDNRLLMRGNCDQMSLRGRYLSHTSAMAAVVETLKMCFDLTGPQRKRTIKITRSTDGVDFRILICRAALYRIFKNNEELRNMFSGSRVSQPAFNNTIASFGDVIRHRFDNHPVWCIELEYDSLVEISAFHDIGDCDKLNQWMNYHSPEVTDVERVHMMELLVRERTFDA